MNVEGKLKDQIFLPLDRSGLQKALRSEITENKVVWLHGPRGCGKTSLIKTVINETAVYVDCEAPEAELRDVTTLSEQVSGKVVVLDEVHAAPDYVELVQACLGNAQTIVLLSSAISEIQFDVPNSAIAHFRLSSIRADDYPKDGGPLALRRLHRGGMPGALNLQDDPDQFFRSWCDAVMIRDLQWAYGARDPRKLLKLLLYLMQHSGEVIVLAHAASQVNLSTGTVGDLLGVLEKAGIISVVFQYGVPPKKASETRRIYFFDTGLVSWARGWRQPEQADLELLWKHFVLDHLRSSHLPIPIRYWQDGQNGIDFVVEVNSTLATIDCRWDTKRYSTETFDRFDELFGVAASYLVCNDPSKEEVKRFLNDGIVPHTPDLWPATRLWKTKEVKSTFKEIKPPGVMYSGPRLGRQIETMTVTELAHILKLLPADLPIGIGRTDPETLNEFDIASLKSVVVRTNGTSKDLLLIDSSSTSLCNIPTYTISRELLPNME